MVGPRHQRATDTHRSAAHGHCGHAGISFAGLGHLNGKLIGFPFVIHHIGKGLESAHIAQLAAAVDTALDGAARHVDGGIAFHQTGNHFCLNAHAAAIDGAFHGAALHVHLRFILHLSVGAAAIHIAKHLVGCIANLDIHLGIAGRGELCQRRYGIDDTTACAIHMAAIEEFCCQTFIHHLTDGAAIDVHRTFRSARIITRWRRADGGHGAAAIHVAVDGAAVDGHVGVQSDRACRSAVAVGNTVVVGVVLIDAPTGTIYITTIGPFIGCNGVGAFISRSDFALVDGDVGVPTHMAVVATTKHRTLDGRTSTLSRWADVDHGLVDIAKEEVAAVVVARVIIDGFEGRAFRRTEDIAVVVAITRIASGADGAAVDGDGGRAAVFVWFWRRWIRLFICQLAIAHVVALAHRGQVAAAEDIVLHRAAVDDDFGVAIHLAGGDAALRRCWQVFAWILRILQCNQISTRAIAAAKHRACDEAVVHRDLGVVIDRAVFARAIHRT